MNKVGNFFYKVFFVYFVLFLIFIFADIVYWFFY